MSPAFVVGVVVLVVAGIGIRPGMARLEKMNRKETISMARSFDDFDTSSLPSFAFLPEALPPIVGAGEIGTEDYKCLAFQHREKNTPPSFLVMTYYSNPQERVPHAPEVCYRQAGTVVNSMNTIRLDTPGLGPEHQEIDARLIQFEQGSWKLFMLYVFVANGEYRYDREQVRMVLGRPGKRHLYMSKVEAVIAYQGKDEEVDTEGMVEVTKQLMREVLPVLKAEHFPADADLL
jgi:hypothetical protein